MKMSPVRFVTALLWIASLVSAYWAGGHFKAHSMRKGDATSPPIAITIDPRKAGPSSEGKDKGEGMAGNNPESADSTGRDVRGIVEKARLDLGSGNTAMFNPSAAFRALGPLMDLSIEEVRAALAEVAATVTDPQQSAMFESMLLARWAEEDPRAALAYAEARIDQVGLTAAQSVFSVVGVWAQQDPEAAWGWYRKKRDSDEPVTGMMGIESHLMLIFRGLADRDLDGTLDRLALLDDESELAAAHGGIALAASDPARRDQIIARSATMEAGTRDSLRQSLVGSWAALDPTGAMEWLGSLPREERTPLISTTEHTLMLADPERGAALLMENAGEGELSHRYDTVISAWASRDPYAAGEWLNRQPKDPAQDSARQSFANVVVRRDPEAAIAWAHSISDDGQRQASLGSVYRQWQKRDPAAADAALDLLGLPAGQVETIRQMAK